MIYAYLSVSVRPPIDPANKTVSIVGAAIHSVPIEELTQNLRLAYFQGPSAPGETFEEARNNLITTLRAMPQWLWIFSILPDGDRFPSQGKTKC